MILGGGGDGECLGDRECLGECIGVPTSLMMTYFWVFLGCWNRSLSLGDEVVEGSPKVEAPALSNDADCRLKRGSQVSDRRGFEEGEKGRGLGCPN